MTNEIAEEQKLYDLMPPEEKLKIDKAIEHINNLIINKYYQTAIDVGNYVLKEFFKDDINEVRSKNPFKEMSFKVLCERSKSTVHPKHLYQMVVVAAQERFLKEKLKDDVSKLGYSLKVELLKIRDDKLRIKTAKKWIANPVTIAEAKKYIVSLTGSSAGMSDIIPLSSPFISQLKIISEWTENEELQGKLEGLSINKIKKIKEQIDSFLEKYEPVKAKIDGVKAKIDPIYNTKKDEIEAKAAAPKNGRGRPSKPKK